MTASTGRRRRWTNERFDNEIKHVARTGDLVMSRSKTRVPVRCDQGHEWTAHVTNLAAGKGCAECCRDRRWANDPQRWTDEKFDREFPHLARLSGASGVFAHVSVRGECGHEWSASPGSLRVNGCPLCSTSGFNPSKPAHIYLMERPGEQQIGISNDIERRLREHSRDGWSLVDLVGPMDGRVALDWETRMRRTIKSRFEAVPGKRENWLTSSFVAASITAIEC